MAWTPIDFQGTVAFDRNFAEQLIRYFEERESSAAQAMLSSIHMDEQGFPPLSLPDEGIKLTLHESVEAFSRKIRQAAQSKLPIGKDSWKGTTDEINRAFWGYLEVLEEAVQEIFQQIDFLGFVNWKPDLVHILALLKEVIAHRLEDFLWVIKRMENKLWEYRWVCEGHGDSPPLWEKLYSRWSSLIDKSILENLEKCLNLLNSRYEAFLRKSDRYFKQNESIVQSLQKFDQYKVFWALDSEQRTMFMQLYKILKLWEVNAAAKNLPDRDIGFAVQSLTSQDKLIKTFRDYLGLLRGKLYDSSRAIKQGIGDVMNQWVRKDAVDYITGLRTELHTLRAVASKYREFLLRTDPNPYVRSRWGFSETIAGPEPAVSKTLVQIDYEIETVDHLCEKFNKVIESSPEEVTGKKLEYPEVDGVLHEMAQPLLSKNRMRSKAERFSKLLEQVDELGSFDRDSIDYIGNHLAKGMRLDWKYNVLHELTAFHQLYGIHQGILGPIEDRAHSNRLSRIKKILQHFHKWIEGKDTPKHTHEIESDLTDIKGYLQDFFASVQRISKEGSGESEDITPHLEKIERCLLEYRYVFGQFFSKLQLENPEERMIRNNFLFADQYFEAVESKLQELKAAPK
jgi:hypothetical protein